MAKIIWSTEASKNLESIFRYIEDKNPAAAGRTVRGILDRIDQLADSPLSGHEVEWHADPPLRSTNFGHYRIIHRSTQETVFIVGVFHGAMDIRTWLDRSK